ncbi:hypothetical protein SLEP1_g5942 [Rubroshorea leprosula]|uniref:Uncharacterized protein n=1 Tax=Rubroshorea leprosula TaxID=152421 RepID=A0AAV5I2N1_9ROSI|nr:hypothetical protein SLEP1_g5942 [Rubroshorea leprosula]
MLQHPSGCVTIISVHGREWGRFGTLHTIIFCSLEPICWLVQVINFLSMEFMG